MIRRFRTLRSERTFAAVLLVGSAAVISVLHYLSSTQALLVHEILKRLYYVPIVTAAVHYGARAGLAMSALSSAMYLPHIVMSWSGWPPLFEVGQYGEVVLFNVVGAVTGIMADRLRSERNRYRRTTEALEVAYGQLQASTERRLQAERMAAVGHMAAGVAHEIRTPLGAILGCFEILATDYPAGHPKLQFIDILKREIARAEEVVSMFLGFAEPVPPRCLAADVNDIVRAAARRFTGWRPEYGVGGLGLDLSPSLTMCAVDPQQMERSIVELLMVISALAPRERVTVSTRRTRGGDAEIHLHVKGLKDPLGQQAFERFDSGGRAGTVMLPLIRRVLENQGAAITASRRDTELDVAIAVPQAGLKPAAAGAASVWPAAAT
jgi:signal transduction histidine kinase